MLYFRVIRIVGLLFVVSLSQASFAQKLTAEDSVSLTQNMQFFQQIKEICDADNGRLLGFGNYYCPIMIVNRESRFVVANTSLPFSDKAPINGVYYGVLPEKYNIANSTIDIDTTLYAMFNSDIPTDMMSFVCLHEMFHYWQEKKDMGRSYNNAHIDTKWARVYLILELKALQNALLSEDEQQHQAILEALTFRKQRHLLFPQHIEDETNFEFHEGFPDFVACKLLYTDDNEVVQQKMYDNIERRSSDNSFYRNFGYTTGATYAYLIRDFELYRTKLFQISDIVSTMMQSRNITDIPDIIPKEYKEKYNFEQVVHHEDSVAEYRQYLFDSIANKFTKEPLIVVEWNKDVHIGFNPNQMFSMDSLGTYYSLMHISGDFGTMQTEKGVLMQNDYLFVFVDKDLDTGKNSIRQTFKIVLNKGWFLVKQNAHYFIVKKK
ncbi:MAG: hypothetical protein LBQ64_03775 [Bacteroidales bacterium]|nr:hypothetical protein [Bacteroidales bacterium]